MREILFRGWTIGEFSWEYGFLSWLDTPRGRGYFINNKRIDERTLGQFTGMIDKNGTKIFEGDIVRESFKGHGRIYHVFWDDDYFAFRAKGEDITYHLDEIVESHCEVIGNIHDNKELLK